MMSDYEREVFWSVVLEEAPRVLLVVMLVVWGMRAIWG